MNLLKFFVGVVILLCAAYPAYQIKSALGIDIISNYHAPDTLIYGKKAITKIKRTQKFTN